MMELIGFTTWIAVDGHQAMSTFMSARSRLSVLILDWNMPGMSGIEVFEKIRSLDPSIPIILTSAYRPDERILELQAQGNLSFLRKPFTMDTLRATLVQRLTQVQTA